MARFVSPHRNFSLGIRDGKPAHLGPDGKMVPEQPELHAQFNPDWRTDIDLALAKSTFTFRGLAIYENGQEVNPAYRISVYDSELAKLRDGLSDEDEALIVEKLRNSGPIGQMYVEVIPAAASKPWNGYDDLKDADRIVELALAINADLERVVQYERENLNRPAVVDALKAAIEKAGETITVSA
jgi:hypothetical protein